MPEGIDKPGSPPGPALGGVGNPETEPPPIDPVRAATGLGDTDCFLLVVMPPEVGEKLGPLAVGLIGLPATPLGTDECCKGGVGAMATGRAGKVGRLGMCIPGMSALFAGKFIMFPYMLCRDPAGTLPLC